jgi:sensor histidine kinase YesM
MILQPFVENAIEHGLRPKQEGRLTIRFELLAEDEKLLRCIIEDDGIGYNKGREKHTPLPGFQKHRSRGMEITTERLSLLHELQHHVGVNFLQINDLADLTLGSRSGTRVEVLLPLMEEA